MVFSPSRRYNIKTIQAATPSSISIPLTHLLCASMVADVASLFTVINQSHGFMTTPPITRDLLGGAATGTGADDLHSSKELDLDLHVPSGFEKRLDLKSGNVYLQRCKSPDKSSSKLQDLNFPDQASRKPLNIFNDKSLDLKLVPLSGYQSVCTLDKVKFALERAEKETTTKKRSISMSKSCSSSSSIRETEFDDDGLSEAYAAGCPSCLLYVLISRSNPKCPRCNMNVPSPTPTPTPTSMKKPRIDLNVTI